MIGTNKCFIGIDVSKLYFDASLMAGIGHVKQPKETARFDNNSAGLRGGGGDRWLRARKLSYNELQLCALSAIQYNQEIKNYYNRKKDEGKHSMAVLNAVRNKIVFRIAAVVKSQKPLKNNYKIVA